MTAGLPGAGIGGVFYLLSALLMPVWEAVRRRRCAASRRRWGLSVRMSLLAGAMLSAIWLTGWLLGLVLIAHPEMVAGAAPSPVDAAAPQVIGRGMVALTLGTLAAVLVGVELLRLVMKGGRASVSIPVTDDPAKNEAA